jgi:hypothetical protein
MRRRRRRRGRGGHTFLNWNEQKSVSKRFHCETCVLLICTHVMQIAYRPTSISKICYLDFNITDFMDWIRLIHQLLGIWA